MEVSQQDVSSQKACNKLLHLSCEIYSDMNSLYGRLESNMSSSPKLIIEINERTNDLQEQARAVDSNLKYSLAEVETLSEENTLLLQKRTTLLQNLILRNKKITQKVSAVRSHLLHEVNSIHANRSAMKGYKPHVGNSVGLINKRF